MKNGPINEMPNWKCQFLLSREEVNICIKILSDNILFGENTPESVLEKRLLMIRFQRFEDACQERMVWREKFQEK